MSSKTPDKKGLSLGLSLIGIAAGAADRILPINIPLAMGFKRKLGILKLSLLMRAALVLASRASFLRYGAVLQPATTQNVSDAWILHTSF